MDGLAPWVCARCGSTPYGMIRRGGARIEAIYNFFGLDHWIARNPLKSPESDEGIQENPSPFPWFLLVWLGFGLE